MKKLKPKNSLFILIAIASLVVSLGTGCGGSSSKSSRTDSIGNPPKDPSLPLPDYEGPDESTIPDKPPARNGEPV